MSRKPVGIGYVNVLQPREGGRPLELELFRFQRWTNSRRLTKTTNNGTALFVRN